ncbi:hypothetical protein SKAU_G00160960 [Synaphobranchus kaupii]|uniref:C2H2-type domain-containing protein n=1 Tax=Synaphobranchus kaupii TaxID=118154 RepID=A0A9Q1FIN8_SYNKA|nr:hypothetical protein SKAU_G00160960 [Synaphobranchus kaupii]
MFRGRPQRGGFPRPYGPPHHGHSPPGPGRPLPPGPYREDRDRERDRERHGYHHGYPEDYRRSPPRRRYPSPGSSSYRGPSGEYRGNGPPPPREHKRVTPSPTRGDVPIDRSLVITVGNELTGSQAPRGSRNTEHHYERDYHKGDPHYKHASGMRPGHEQESDERYRRRSHSRGRSRPRSRSHSRGRGRSKSRARSRSRSRGKSRARSRSRGRSKSRGRSRSRSRSRGRSRAQSRARSRLREKSRSRSGSSSSSGNASPALKSKRKDEFRELEMARRRKELEELLGVPTKSILKKRIDSETDSPAAVQSSDSPVDVSGDHQSSSLSRETERFLSAVTKGMESGLFSSMLGDMTERPHDQRMQAMAQGLNLGQYQEILSRVKQETDGDGIGEFLLPHERVRQDSGGFSRILGGMGNQPDLQEKRKSFAEIEDEERFLYGEDEEGDKEKVAGQSHPATPARAQRSHSQTELSSPYGDGRPELAKYRDSKLAMSQYHDSKPEVPEYTGGQEYMQRCHSQAGVAHNLLSEAYAAAADSPYRHSSAASEDRLDARSLRGSHQQIQPDMRYHHRGQPIAATAQKDGGQAGAPQEEVQPEAYPPGLDPKETKERQEVEEYEKIQDLLKAIGLDLGVAEISKMAARTQERLHGKKPPAGPSRRAERLQDRRDRRKSHSSSSSSSSSHSRSPDWSRGRSRGRSRGHSRGRSRKRSHDSERRSASPRPSRRISLGETLTAPGRSESDVTADDSSWGIPVLGKGGPQPRITVSMNPPPSLASIPQQVTAMGAHAIQAVSGYQSQTPAYPMPTPNYPPPGYGQYEGYMPYMTQRWPMYPPPSLVVPPRSPVEEVPVSSASTRPYLRVIETVAMETKDSRSSQAANKASKPDSGGGFTSQTAKEESSQSQRLSEEKNQASQKQKVIEEREKLKKERDVRMKKKEYLMKELERLRKQQGELLRKKRREKDGHKDPLLGELGRLQEEVMVQISSLRKEHEAAEKKRAELDKVALILGLGKHRKEGRASGEFEPPPERTPEKAPSTPSSSVPSSKATSTLRSSPEKPKPKSQHGATAPEKSAELYEYYDSGNHWCKNCNTVCGSMFDFFTHLHSKSHKKTRDPYDRPWASNSSSKEKKRTPGEKIVRPAKGSEFLVPVIGFYCQLCEEFFGDQICAEDHVTCHKHNEKYKKRIDEHPMYEQRRNLDRQAGLSVATDNRERKHGELKRKLETEPSGTQEDNPSSQGEETPPRNRDRRSQSSRYEKPTSYKDEKSYSHREEKLPGHREDRTSGHREERRASVKEEKEGRKRTPPVPEDKSEPQRPVELAEKQRVICGPSPSILAKVRKRNEEAVKSSASTSAFGKFSWKKTEKEKEQEYEEEKEEKAVENVTEEENDEDDSGDKEDGKSALAKAKTIAIKLSGKTIIPPSNAWVPFASAQPPLATKIRPILPAPMMVLRKSNPSSKPASLTTFLSIKPSGTNSNKPLPVVKPQKDAVLTPDLISKAFGGEEVVLKAPEVPVKTTPPSEKNQKKSTPDVKKPPAKPTASAQPQEPPPPGMHMIFESDVAAPGVPVSEQTMAVVVCPPPLHMTEGPQKNDKPKSSLAAAKAQDLYDIFYSSGTKGGSDLLAGTKQPKSGETTKSKDSGVCGPKTESKSKMNAEDAQTSDSSIILQLEDQTLQIPSPEKDSPFTQLEMVDLDLFTFNFE